MDDGLASSGHANGPYDRPGDDPRPDHVLARQAALGDREAFTAIFDRHAVHLFRYCLRMLDGDYAESEDAVQEAMARAWAKLPTFRGESSLRTWLFRLAINEATNRRRRRRPVAADTRLLEPRPAGQHHEPEHQALADDLGGALTRALSELPWRQRAAWLLREIEGLSYAEIALALDTTPTVVRGQLSRARGTLVVRLEQWR